MGVAHLSVADLWKQISTIPIDRKLEQMKKFSLAQKKSRNCARTNSAFPRCGIGSGYARLGILVYGLVRRINLVGVVGSGLAINIKGGAT